MIDLKLWITGGRPTTVQTVGNRICTKETAFRYADYAAATFQFPQGRIGRITANFGCVHGHQHVVRIFGTHATFLHDDQGTRYQTHRDRAPAAERLQLTALPSSKHVLIDHGLVYVKVPDGEMAEVEDLHDARVDRSWIARLCRRNAERHHAALMRPFPQVETSVPCGERTFFPYVVGRTENITITTWIQFPPILIGTVSTILNGSAYV